MRPSLLPAELDGLRLRAELAAATSAGWTHGPSRAAGLARLKRYLDRGRAHAAARLDGKGGGLEAARVLANVTNAAMRALFDSLMGDEFEAGARTPGVALCAIGGYGAGELGPQSDIDLMFLTGPEAPDGVKAVAERLLYVVWDSGLPVGGGAIRTKAEALALAQEDVPERTALLDLRPISGDEALVGRLKTAFDAQLRAGDAASFVAAKLEEREARVERQGDSRYAVEPNIKDGKGAMRDLQTLRWLAQVLYGGDALERWVGDGLLNVADVERYLGAADFFWTVRFHLHDLTGRKDDRLSFDVQPEIAARMSYADTEDVLAVETFMRDFFRCAIDVGALTRLVSAKLEADELKTPPAGIGRFLPSQPNFHAGDSVTADLAEAGFVLRRGRLDFAETARLHADPVLLLRLFELAAMHGVDLHPDAFATVSHALPRVDEDFRRNARAARSFFATLLDAEDPRMTLRAMTEAGLLGAFIPEFGDVVARTQFNMYHRYTVDEHTLNALGFLREIEQGRLEADHPLSTRLAPKIKHRRALHLAVLLHDTGKGQGDQCIEGAERARAACERLGLDQEEGELVAWLVRNHLEMSDAAQRRDISDPRTVLDFAERVGSLERLRLLTLLTVVDIRAVGPGVWNGWKAQLIRDLYQAAAAVLSEDKRPAENEARARLKQRAERARARFLAQMDRVDPDFAQHWMGALDDTYWLAFSETDRMRHAAFVRAALQRGEDVAAGVRIDRNRSATEVLVLARDRHGLFADIAGALAENAANVVGAQVFTTSGGRAFDVFYVQEQGGKPYGWSETSDRDRLKARVEDAAGEGATRSVIPKRRIMRREAAFRVSPWVKIDAGASDDSLLIEASGRDRAGLLHDLTRALTEMGLSLQAARIDGYGERAVDTFYVTRDGAKPDPDSCGEALRARLLTILGAPEAAVEQGRAESGLAQADANFGR